MIIAKPVGGLANQMGVYAAAKALAKHHNVPLKLDISASKKNSIEEYSLDRLNIEPEIATQKEIDTVLGKTKSQLVNNIKKKINKKTGLMTLKIYKEKSLNYDSGFFSLPDSIYLLGNFLSIDYYASVMDELASDFTIKSEGTEETKRWKEEIIKYSNSVSLHIRRGDYKYPKTKKFHGLLDLNYFEKSINFIEDNVEDPVFFVFSDEIDWVRDHLKTKSSVHYVDCHSPLEGHLDYKLMQSCKHFIISNSGFSRWPALLNKNPKKIVCMPKNWTVEKIINDDEIAPLTWKRL